MAFNSSRWGGRVDALSAPSVVEMLKKQFAEGKYSLVIEMGRLTYVSSAGVFVFLNELKEARSHGGDLRVANAPKDIHKILELSGFFDFLYVRGSPAQRFP